jgi:hypothetical protein
MLLLEALLRFRLARTSDLSRVAFSGVRLTTASLRLRRLFDAGFVDVRAGDRSEENVYSLGPVGRRWAEAQGLAVGRVPHGSVSHHLAIVRAWSSLAAELGRHEGVELERAHADWDLREELGSVGLAVVPDLLLVLRFGDRSLAVAVEVDLGTESLAVLRAKIAAYAELDRRRGGLFGYRGFAFAVAVGTTGRLAGVRRLVERDWPGKSLTWQLDEDLGVALGPFVGGLVGGLVGTGTDPDCGNGGVAAVSGSESGLEPTDEEGL